MIRLGVCLTFIDDYKHFDSLNLMTFDALSSQTPIAQTFDRYDIYRCNNPVESKISSRDCQMINFEKLQPF
jgi:hypothetical protein